MGLRVEKPSTIQANNNQGTKTIKSMYAHKWYKKGLIEGVTITNI